MKPVDYKQTDPRWGGLDYSAKGETTTIAKSGCGPTCMAMVLASLVDEKITPKDTAAWSKAHGFKAPNQGTYYTYFKPQGAAFGIQVEQLNNSNLRERSDRQKYHDRVVSEIAAGNIVICCMGPGHWTKNGHFIILHGIEGINALINDPASSAPNRAKAPLATLMAEVKYYFVVVVPEHKKNKVRDGVVSVIAESVRTYGYLKNGNSHVPVRAVAEAFGSKVGWDPKTSTVTVDGRPVRVTNQDGTALAIARELAELIGVNVSWDEKTKTVTFKRG